MIGFRGASRYYDERYREGFALECRALKRVRDEMGLTNVKIMVPFCRTVDEARRVVQELARNGLARRQNGLELYMMVEIPSNVILLPEFAEYFDGFSIGSNDLTQLTLGVDRDSEIVAHVFDERNAAVQTLIAQAIAYARGSAERSACAARRRATTRSSRDSSSSAASTACRSTRTPCCRQRAWLPRPSRRVGPRLHHWRKPP